MAYSYLRHLWYNNCIQNSPSDTEKIEELPRDKIELCTEYSAADNDSSTETNEDAISGTFTRLPYRMDAICE